MKKLILIITIIMVLPIGLLAQDTIGNKIAGDITQLKGYLNIADKQTNKLSIAVSKLNSSRPFMDTDWISISGLLEEIKMQMGNINKISLQKLLDNDDQANFGLEYNNFTFQEGRMYETLNSFSKSINDTLYTAQTDLMETKIEHFLTATGNFKQYLQSLIIITPEDLFKKIKTLTDSTDTMVTANKKHIDSLITYNEQQIPKIKKRIEKVQRKTDTIINLLKRDTLLINQYLTGAAYNDNVFGISYLRRIGSAKPVIPGNFWGLEFIMPISSVSVKNPGGFLLYGLRDDKILIEAGAGYLKTNMSREDVSWKAGLLYLPKKFGIGLSYSPLTNIGLQLAYNL